MTLSYDQGKTCCFDCQRFTRGDCPNPCPFRDSGKKCKDPARCIACEIGFEKVQA